MKWLSIYLLLIPATCLAQINITGKVTNADDKSPVTNASIFLSNATVGNKTDEKGIYTLTGVRPGQYELVVTIVGFETYRQNVMAANQNISLPDILLKPKTTELKEVNIRPDPDWENKYFTFKKEFLGYSPIAQQCKILNPEVLNLNFDKQTRVLSASSYDFLEINNIALGYKIKYLLSQFTKDNKDNRIYFEGSALFEEMQGSKADKKRWQRNREKVYLGSNMHFLRSILGNNLAGNQFEVMRLIRKPNPDYHGGLNQYRFSQTLISQPLTIDDFVRLTDSKGVYALSFKDCLYVIYTKKKGSGQNEVAYKPMDAPDYPTSIITFNDDYALFDNNGIIINPASLTFEGNWGGSRMAEMLPVDYVGVNSYSDK